MNARAAELVAGDRERWPLAGDQLYVDLDLSGEHLPPGTRLAVGSAVIEVTGEPHTGCKKFSTRFGLETLEFVNSPEGRALNLRGINTRVVEPGTVRVGRRRAQAVARAGGRPGRPDRRAARSASSRSGSPTRIAAIS